nr:probable transcriptional regulatory protein OEOE_0768 [Megalopta genalis]XP_033328722.1 probable transcriptional regulatory protein OEOE_0768 [Megalopta genalis]
MNCRLSFLTYNRCRNILLEESRRYAGHSKWQNIRHTKAAIDAARSMEFKTIITKMKIAVQETGISDPSKNVRLAQLVEQAKKANMPSTTLNTFFEKLKISKQNVKKELLLIRCPGGSILVLHILTDNLTKVKLEICSKLKRHNAKLLENTALRIFDTASYITTTKQGGTVDEAIEDAIKVNAQDVEEIKEEDETFFQFKYDFGNATGGALQLSNLGYSVIDTEDLCIPENTVELNEDDLSNCNKLKEKLLAILEVEKIDDNLLES